MFLFQIVRSYINTLFHKPNLLFLQFFPFFQTFFTSFLAYSFNLFLGIAYLIVNFCSVGFKTFKTLTCFLS